MAVDSVEAHSKRDENMMEIQKSKREETLLEKRREALNSQPSSGYDQRISLDEKVNFL